MTSVPGCTSSHIFGLSGTFSSTEPRLLPLALLGPAALPKGKPKSFSFSLDVPLHGEESRCGLGEMVVVGLICSSHDDTELVDVLLDLSVSPELARRWRERLNLKGVFPKSAVGWRRRLRVGGGVVGAEVADCEELLGLGRCVEDAKDVEL